MKSPSPISREIVAALMDSANPDDDKILALLRKHGLVRESQLTAHGLRLLAEVFERDAHISDALVAEAKALIHKYATACRRG